MAHEEQRPALPPEQRPAAQPDVQKNLDLATIAISIAGSGLAGAAGSYVGTKLAGAPQSPQPPPADPGPSVVLPPGVDK